MANIPCGEGWRGGRMLRLFECFEELVGLHCDIIPHHIKNSFHTKLNNMESNYNELRHNKSHHTSIPIISSHVSSHITPLNNNGSALTSPHIQQVAVTFPKINWNNVNPSQSDAVFEFKAWARSTTYARTSGGYTVTCKGAWGWGVGVGVKTD